MRKVLGDDDLPGSVDVYRRRITAGNVKSDRLVVFVQEGLVPSLVTLDGPNDLTRIVNCKHEPVAREIQETKLVIVEKKGITRKIAVENSAITPIANDLDITVDVTRVKQAGITVSPRFVNKSRRGPNLGPLRI